MTMHATLYGRAAFDARQYLTKAGKPMTTLRLAVDVSNRDAIEQETLWIDALAFGRAADDLARVEKGQMVSAMGKVVRGQYTSKEGEIRERWSLLTEAVITARTGRPGQHRSQDTSTHPPAQPDPQAPDFDDPLPDF
ncbi:MAG: single-stranded DNA-binding protein [Chromatiaceae bacterium]|nr:single-stranded DNA-binding protein [Chromatiaceae bacterium]MCF8003027.1 single-stranded DNA-binding protein [Chromatiaceae bacterium]